MFSVVCHTSYQKSELVEANHAQLFLLYVNIFPLTLDKIKLLVKTNNGLIYSICFVICNS